MTVRIEIICKGPMASGKSLAIADMLAGLKDGNHFVQMRKISHHQDLGVEIEVFELSSRYVTE